MQSRGLVLIVAGVVLVGGVLGWSLLGGSPDPAGSEREVTAPPPPSVGTPLLSDPVPAAPPAIAPVPMGPPGTEAEFQAEWAGVRESVIARDPNALPQVRALAERWKALTPRPVELLEVQSLVHLMSVEDAARALEARRPTP